jgi:hypothetical protein
LEVRLLSLSLSYNTPFYSHNRSGGVTTGMTATFDIFTHTHSDLLDHYTHAVVIMYTQWYNNK